MDRTPTPRSLSLGQRSSLLVTGSRPDFWSRICGAGESDGNQTSAVGPMVSLATGVRGTSHWLNSNKGTKTLTEFAMALRSDPDRPNCVLVRFIDRFQRQMLIDLEAFLSLVSRDELNLRVGEPVWSNYSCCASIIPEQAPRRGLHFTRCPGLPLSIGSGKSRTFPFP
jgi:hypothetical protein